MSLEQPESGPKPREPSPPFSRRKFLKAISATGMALLGVSSPALGLKEQSQPPGTQPTQIIPTIPQHPDPDRFVSPSQPTLPETVIPLRSFEDSNKKLTELWTKPVESQTALYIEVSKVKARQFSSLFGNNIQEHALVDAVTYLSHDTYMKMYAKYKSNLRDGVPLAITFGKNIYLDRDRLEEDIDKICSDTFPDISKQYRDAIQSDLHNNRQAVAVEYLGATLAHEWGHLHNIPQKMVNLRTPVAAYYYGDQSADPLPYWITGFNNYDMALKSGSNPNVILPMQKKGRNLVSEFIAEWHAVTLAQFTGRKYISSYADISWGASIINTLMNKVGMAPSEVIPYLSGKKPIAELFAKLDGAMQNKSGSTLRLLQSVIQWSAISTEKTDAEKKQLYDTYRSIVSQQSGLSA